MPICPHCLRYFYCFARHVCNDEQWRREADEDREKEGEEEEWGNTINIEPIKKCTAMDI